MEHLGLWTNNLDELKSQFVNAKPFEYVIINNFFTKEYAYYLNNIFPTPVSYPNLEWYKYNNPLERKFALNKFTGEHNAFNMVFDLFKKIEFINLIKGITDISNLEYDPHLHGAGLHAYPHNGKLDMHLDYSIHPISGKERRINLIYYLNDNWNDKWGGHLELRDQDLSEETKRKILPEFNTAIIFRTCDISFHGIPKPMTAPSDIFRKSLAFYYVSDPRPNVIHRYKAQYFPLPNQNINENLKQLYNIRSTRLLCSNDLEPNWENNGNGFW